MSNTPTIEPVHIVTGSQMHTGTDENPPTKPQISTSDFLDVLLDTIEHQIIPKTDQGVAAGNKIFGAALLRKSDLSLVLAETNNETENPLWHGEVHTLKRFYENSWRYAPWFKRIDLPLNPWAMFHVPFGHYMGWLW